MSCFSPITGYRTPAGKVTFKQKEGYYDKPVTIACGQCRGCRLERSRQWAVRCVHEAQMHADNSFITLTYDDDHLPEWGSLVLRDWQLFVKRLRKKSPFRYYHCGEYGDKRGRPHYHAILFGLAFPDQVYEETKNGNKLYSSPTLSAAWQHQGICRVGAMTFKSAAYVARYCMKKQNNSTAEEHYEVVNTQTGETHQLKPEYATMSRNKGIGSSWFAKYHTDIFPSDQCVINGKVTRPPKFYDYQYELTEPDSLALVKEGRVKSGRKHRANNTPERLRIRETIQEKRNSLLLRTL